MARCSRFEDVSIADFLHATQHLLTLHAIDGGLDGSVGGPVAFGKRFLDLSDGAGTASPEGIHDLKFELCELRRCHPFSYYRRLYFYYACSYLASAKPQEHARNEVREKNTNARSEFSRKRAVVPDKSRNRTTKPHLNFRTIV